MNVVESETKKGGSTTEYKVHFTRAVFEFHFEDTDREHENDWGLEKNPCWPKALAPKDPGFALLADDKYYEQVLREKEEHTKNIRKPYSERACP